MSEDFPLKPAKLHGMTGKIVAKGMRELFLSVAKKILEKRPMPEMWTESDEQLLYRTQYYIGSNRFVNLLERTFNKYEKEQSNGS